MIDNIPTPQSSVFAIGQYKIAKSQCETLNEPIQLLLIDALETA
jgi:hypothetical protein